MAIFNYFVYLITHVIRKILKKNVILLKKKYGQMKKIERIPFV